jgi:hypothetical protein
MSWTSTAYVIPGTDTWSAVPNCGVKIPYKGLYNVDVRAEVYSTAAVPNNIITTVQGGGVLPGATGSSMTQVTVANAPIHHTFHIPVSFTATVPTVQLNVQQSNLNGVTRNHSFAVAPYYLQP